MKNMFKSLLMGALLLSSVFALQAATLSTNVAAAGTNNVLASGAAITQVTAANATGSAVTIQIFDAPAALLTYTVGAYTNMTRTVVNVTNSYTSRNGFVISNTNTVLRETAGVQGSTTPSYRSVIILTVPAGETVTYTPTTPLVASQGLLLTNQAAINLTIDYVPVR